MALPSFKQLRPQTLFSCPMLSYPHCVIFCLPRACRGSIGASGISCCFRRTLLPGEGFETATSREIAPAKALTTQLHTEGMIQPTKTSNRVRSPSGKTITGPDSLQSAGRFRRFISIKNFFFRDRFFFSPWPFGCLFFPCSFFFFLRYTGTLLFWLTLLHS